MVLTNFTVEETEVWRDEVNCQWLYNLKVVELKFKSRSVPISAKQYCFPTLGDQSRNGYYIHNTDILVI